MKLPYLLALSSLALGAFVAGCGGGGQGGRVWSVFLNTPDDIANYEFVITRNNRLPDESTDQCSTRDTVQPDWCSFFEDGSAEFRVDNGGRPYRTFVRRRDGVEAQIDAELTRVDNRAGDARRDITLNGFDFVYLWEINNDNFRYFGTTITGRNGKTKNVEKLPGWTGKR